MPSSICPIRTRTTGVVRRLSATAAIGALLGLPLAMPASAVDPARVTFTGGGLLLCGSKPDTGRISVPAKRKVRLTDKPGIDAKLNIGETVRIQVHRGPVTIGMVRDCPLNLKPTYEQLTVDVKPAAGSGPAGGANDGSPPALGATLFPDPAMPGVELPSGAILKAPANVVHPGRSQRGRRLAGDTGPVDKGSIGRLAIFTTGSVVTVSACLLALLSHSGQLALSSPS